MVNLTTIVIIFLASLLYHGATTAQSKQKREVLPPDPVVKVGTTLNLTCNISSHEKAKDYDSSSIFFEKGSQKFTDLKLVSQDTAMLSIVNIQPGDDGTYLCYVGDSNHSFWIANQKVSVGYPPEQPGDITCISENHYNMTCSWELQDTLLPTTTELLWSKEEDKEVHKCERFIGRNKCFFERNKNNSTYVYPKWYHFKLKIENQFGVVWKNVSIETNSTIVRPFPVRQLSAHVLNSTSINMTWKVPDDLAMVWKYPSKGLIYRISWQSKWDDYKMERNVTDQKNQENIHVVLTELWPYTDYNITVSVKPTIKGYWSQKNNITSKTLESVPAVAPELCAGCLHYDYGKPGKVLVQVFWKKIPSKQGNGIITGYEVTAIPFLHNRSPVSVSVPQDKLSEELSLQDLGQKWTVEVNAKTGQGFANTPSVIHVLPDRQRPKVPANFAVEVKKPNIVVFTWSSPEEASGNNLKGYTFYWCKGVYKQSGCGKNEALNWTHVQRINMTSYELTLEETQGEIQHLFKFAMSVEDTSNVSSGLVWPQEKCNFLYNKAPAAPPSQLRFKHDLVQSERKLAVQWHKIDCSRQTVGRLLHYQIRYCLVEGGRKCNGQDYQYKNVSALITETELDNLHPNSEYAVSIQAVSGGGHSGFSNEIVTKTKQSAPSVPPGNITVVKLTTHNVTLSWQPSPQPNGIVSEYKIYMVSNQSYSPSAKVPGNQTYVTIKDLEGDQPYTFTVQACTSNGNKCSVHSKEFNLTTPIGVPGPVSNIEITVSGEYGEQALVKWTKPVMENGPITGYLVHVGLPNENRTQYLDVSKNRKAAHQILVNITDCVERGKFQAEFSVQANNSLGQLGQVSKIKRAYLCQAAGLTSKDIASIIIGCSVAGVVVAAVVAILIRCGCICKKRLRLREDEKPEYPPDIRIDDDLENGRCRAYSMEQSSEAPLIVNLLKQEQLEKDKLESEMFMKQTSVDSGFGTPSPKDIGHNFSFGCSNSTSSDGSDSSLEPIPESDETCKKKSIKRAVMADSGSYARLGQNANPEAIALQNMNGGAHAVLEQDVSGGEYGKLAAESMENMPSESSPLARSVESNATPSTINPPQEWTVGHCTVEMQNSDVLPNLHSKHNQRLDGKVPSDLYVPDASAKMSAEEKMKQGGAQSDSSAAYSKFGLHEGPLQEEGNPGYVDNNMDRLNSNVPEKYDTVHADNNMGGYVDNNMPCVKNEHDTNGTEKNSAGYVDNNMVDKDNLAIESNNNSGYVDNVAASQLPSLASEVPEDIYQPNEMQPLTDKDFYTYKKGVCLNDAKRSESPGVLPYNDNDYQDHDTLINEKSSLLGSQVDKDNNQKLQPPGCTDDNGYLDHSAVDNINEKTSLLADDNQTSKLPTDSVEEEMPETSPLLTYVAHGDMTNSRNENRESGIDLDPYLAADDPIPEQQCNGSAVPGNFDPRAVAEDQGYVDHNDVQFLGSKKQQVWEDPGYLPNNL